MRKAGLLLGILLWQLSASAQKTLTGTIRDNHSDEPIPFASLQFKHTNTGFVADSAGGFHFVAEAWPSDTLVVSNVGYETKEIAVDPIKDSLIVLLDPKDYGDVVVKAKIDMGLYVWKNLVKHRPYNDRFRHFENFYYEIYNKLELDLTHLKTIEKVTRIKPFRPMNDLINKNIDTAEGVKFLPAYLTESISDYYYQKDPLRRREEIKAYNTNGIKNASMVKFLGGMDQVFNVYNDFINVFNRLFVSPVSRNGSAYYKYALSDTQRIDNQKFYHLVFTPKSKGTNTFEGDCWVASGSFAIQKMSLRLDRSADVNFLDRLSLIQEYKKINDSTWFIAKDKFVASFSPIGKQVPGFIARKTTTYQDARTNDSSVANILKQNKKIEEIVVKTGSGDKNQNYWDSARQEGLSTNEMNIMNMMDTVLNSPRYKKITKQIAFLGSGLFNVGNVQLGSAYNWFTGNAWEGFRTRFDVASNIHFDKKLWWHGYLAYGFGDKKFKGEAEAFYLPKKEPKRQYWYLGYKNDLDYGQTYFGEISNDNIFALAIRKPNIPFKYINLEQAQFEFFNELGKGFSVLTNLSRKTYRPLQNLIPADSFSVNKNSLTGTDITLKFRYAFQEKFIESNFFRSSLGSKYPIVEATFIKGVSGLLGGDYNYTKLQGSVSEVLRIPPLGVINYQVYAGKTFGTVPYMFLDVAPGNELYYYNRYAFNMMNRYEFINDRYAGINFEHNIGNGIFKLIPKLKFRQFYTVKALWGALSDENKALNFKEGHNFQSLDGKTYMEVGTGIDNILRFFRVDCIWRVLPNSNIKQSTARFGVFGSVRLTF
ncbi:MAG: carboxypeptidase-like regulatory domain-containing protein [Niabella sp.]|nr:carboxypeptidase-like regulatory domain-containing protein [Niabella sp.]